jgi:hypothetical protein
MNHLLLDIQKNVIPNIVVYLNQVHDNVQKHPPHLIFDYLLLYYPLLLLMYSLKNSSLIHPDYLLTTDDKNKMYDSLVIVIPLQKQR